MRVLVCGSRTWTDGDMIYRALDAHLEADYLTIIEGCARGADWFAHNYGAGNPAVDHEHYPAEWEQHGRRAGPIRNLQMLVHGEPELVLAFTVGRRLTPGTGHMVRIAEEAGVPTVVYYHDARGAA